MIIFSVFGRNVVNDATMNSFGGYMSILDVIMTEFAASLHIL